MTRVPSATGGSGTAAGATDAFRDLDIDHFLKLMIVEMQNQDPLNPMDNQEMLAQISQIREVAATTQLSETLESLLLGQAIASATSLLGKEVVALTDTGSEVVGVVDRVTIAEGKPRLHIGNQSVRLENVRAVIAAEDFSETI